MLDPCRVNDADDVATIVQSNREILTKSAGSLHASVNGIDASIRKPLEQLLITALIV